MLYPDFHELASFRGRRIGAGTSPKPKAYCGLSGNYRSSLRGQGLEFDAVREYVPGDDVRSIDWRVTARMGSPHLKLFRKELERSIVVCVDLNHEMRFGTKRTFKSIQAARVAAFLSWQAMAQSNPLSAYLFGDVPNGIHFLPASRTKKTLWTLLKTLAQPPLESHPVAWSKILQPLYQNTRSGSLIYLISDFMTVSTTSHFKSWLRHLSNKADLVFIAINDPSDQRLIPVGPLICCAGGQKLNIDTDDAKGRMYYEEQWKKSRQDLKDVSFAYQIPLIELTTESEILRELPLALKKIQKWKK